MSLNLCLHPGIQCTTKEHNWGEAMDKMGGPFDIIVACGMPFAPQQLCAVMLHIHRRGCTHQVPGQLA